MTRGIKNYLSRCLPSYRSAPGLPISPPMERRFDDRYLTGLGLTAAQVRVTDLTTPDRAGDGRMTDISGSGMGVVVPFELKPGDILQLDVDDSRLFGFVVHAAPEADGYRVGIELQRVLIGGTDLSRLLHQTLQSALPELPGVSRAHGA